MKLLTALFALSTFSTAAHATVHCTAYNPATREPAFHLTLDWVTEEAVPLSLLHSTHKAVVTVDDKVEKKSYETMFAIFTQNTRCGVYQDEVGSLGDWAEIRFTTVDSAGYGCGLKHEQATLTTDMKSASPKSYELDCTYR